MNHLPRREFRKLMRKQRKKNARIEAAKARQLQVEEEISEEENWEKTVKSIKIPKPITEEEINNKDSNELFTSPSATSVQEDSSEKTDYGTEKDQVNCPFYLKTGACRYGDSCGRYHPYPEKCCTILIKNMYEGMPVQLADENDDDDLEFDEVEAEKHYFDFFEDVHTEFQQYGNIVQFKVCNNFQQHLRGNVYVQYSSEVEAELAIENIRGRWYAGKQLICDYCPVTKWKPAICGYYQRKQCPKGIQCNFLHAYKNPGGLYSDADRDFEDLPWKQSNSIKAIDNSSVSKSVKKLPSESISVSFTKSPKRSRSSSPNKSHPRHLSLERNHKSRSKSRSHSPRRSNDKRHRRHHKRDDHHSCHHRRDEHHHQRRSRHHKKNDRDLNESLSHRNRHYDCWDKKPSDYEADNEFMKKRFGGDKRNFTRDGDESGNDPKREKSYHNLETSNEFRKGSRINEPHASLLC
ncbi:12879_t:CDS:2 [Funneliformis caledonium]|uniref:12879_t:CDS:1 n=1 Tax=Funneliformis caledonium TaxID=1117310 RepID=A0A9N9C4T7_9GLOM|nr:12879_t:CDS:2 [Funneliformis caledonium]